MKKFEIKIPEDILEFMKENIEYGWIDINGNKHIKTMKDFRRLYITTTVHQTLKYGIGTCIDQVNLMHYFFNKINVKNTDKSGNQPYLRIVYHSYQYSI